MKGTKGRTRKLVRDLFSKERSLLQTETKEMSVVKASTISAMLSREVKGR